MKIFFTHSIEFKGTHDKTFLALFEKIGLEYTVKSFVKDRSKLDFDEARELYLLNTKKFKEADIVIAEMSYVSSDTGYLVAEAVISKKPVIVLCNFTENTKNPRHVKTLPVGLKGVQSKYLIMKEYNLNNLELVLKNAIKDAKDLLGSKFNFITTPEIDKYLDWVSKEEGESKSNILRNLIEESMVKNKSYQNYLNEK